MPTMNPRLRRRLRILGGGLAVLALLLAAMFCASSQLLTVQSCVAKADCIVVLGGANWERVPHAAALFQQGVAPKILVSGGGDGADSVRMLERAGVPKAAILREAKSSSTLENAALSAPILRQQGFTSVVLVTSWYHSRRGLACFERAAPELKFYSSPEGHGSITRLWQNRYERGRVFQEWAKLAYYWFVHGIPPW